MNEDLLRQVRRLADESAIRQVIYRYCRGMDRRDWELVASTFHPGAQDDHGVFKGDALDFIEFSKPRHASITMCMHHITNMIVEFESDDRALVESYCVGVHRYAAGSDAARKAITSSTSVSSDQPLELTMWVRYVDVITRRDGEWRISDRRVVWEGMRADALPAEGPTLGAEWPLAKRDASDPVYQLQRDLGIARG